MVAKKPFNDYKIIDDKVIIYLERRKQEPIETVIDLKHFERVKNSGFRWIPTWNDVMKKYYARGTRPIGKYPSGNTKNELVYLHRFIMNAPKDKDVDHHDHDTLNNREYNLIMTSTTLNSKNRCSKNSNNKSGYRNVFWSTNDKRWIVALQIEGKQTYFGRFKYEELDKAGELAEEMRQKHYGEFAGKS